MFILALLAIAAFIVLALHHHLLIAFLLTPFLALGLYVAISLGAIMIAGMVMVVALLCVGR